MSDLEEKWKQADEKLVSLAEDHNLEIQTTPTKALTTTYYLVRVTHKEVRGISMTVLRRLVNVIESDGFHCFWVKPDGESIVLEFWAEE